ncbi:proline-rich receptor-like protein kinase perk5 [Anaeramoeba flamelloides]|uniref:Proline-rich receptor-like protein kinase perk5 n=1 Tax=Anaeramoeba flamelloides TaxID=1746091 RepID=A0AAV7YE72_9EUKA|nr:proline-rich receptor-like protein kinase perk5 [Anaeramoeba flamelloides]
MKIFHSQQILVYITLFLLLYRLSNVNTNSPKEIGKKRNDYDHQPQKQKQKPKTDLKLIYYCQYNKNDPVCKYSEEDTKNKVIQDKKQKFRLVSEERQKEFKIQFVSNLEQVKNFKSENVAKNQMDNLENETINPKFLEQIQDREKKSIGGVLLVSMFFLLFVVILIVYKIKQKMNQQQQQQGQQQGQNRIVIPANENANNNQELIVRLNNEPYRVANNNQQQIQNQLQQQQQQLHQLQRQLELPNHLGHAVAGQNNRHNIPRLPIYIFIFLYLVLYFSEFSTLTESKVLAQEQYNLHCLGGYDQKLTYSDRIKHLIKPRTKIEDKEKFIIECWELNNRIQSKRPSLGSPLETLIEQFGNTFEIVMSKLGSGIGELTKSLFNTLGFKNCIQLAFLFIFTIFLINLVPCFK